MFNYGCYNHISHGDAIIRKTNSTLIQLELNEGEQFKTSRFVIPPSEYGRYAVNITSTGMGISRVTLTGSNRQQLAWVLGYAVPGQGYALARTSFDIDTRNEVGFFDLTIELQSGGPIDISATLEGPHGDLRYDIRDEGMSNAYRIRD